MEVDWSGDSNKVDFVQLPTRIEVRNACQASIASDLNHLRTACTSEMSSVAEGWECLCFFECNYVHDDHVSKGRDRPSVQTTMPRLIRKSRGDTPLTILKVCRDP